MAANDESNWSVKNFAGVASKLHTPESWARAVISQASAIAAKARKFGDDGAVTLDAKITLKPVRHKPIGTAMAGFSGCVRYTISVEDPILKMSYVIEGEVCGEFG